MNIQVIIVELVIFLLIFSFLAFGMLMISPLTFISDYPPEIQEVYYKTQHMEAKKEKFTIIMKIKKLIALLVFLCVFVWMIKLAGAKTFLQGTLLTYLYMFVIFVWDTFFLDWVLFANIKRIRLPGTEHMEKEYHQKWFHVKVCFPMIPITLLMGVIVGFLITIL